MYNFLPTISYVIVNFLRQITNGSKPMLLLLFGLSAGGTHHTRHTELTWWNHRAYDLGTGGPTFPHRSTILYLLTSPWRKTFLLANLNVSFNYSAPLIHSRSACWADVMGSLCPTSPARLAGGRITRATVFQDQVTIHRKLKSHFISKF